MERALALKQPQPGKNMWRTVVGNFAGSDFMRQVDEEGQKLREAERNIAEQEQQGE